MRPRVLEARRAFERDVLLSPVLAALERGNDLQRAAVLAGFDGSFFKGRFYARQPEGMIDVGNDREFGFLYQPNLDLLEGTFSRILTAGLPKEARRRSLQLAGFFRIPERTRNKSIQTALLWSFLADPEPRGSGGGRVTLVAGSPGSSRRRGRPGAASPCSSQPWKEPGADREAVLRAIGRNERLAARPELLATIRKLIAREEAAPSLLPVLHWPAVSDSEVLSLLDQAWPRLTQPQPPRGHRGARLRTGLLCWIAANLPNRR